MADMMKKLGKGGMKGLATQMAGMGGMGPMGGAGGMRGGAPELSALGGGNAPKGDNVDFDALERAMKGLGPTPPGLGLPGTGKKK